MNVFILNSGRCGSTTFIQACQHIENYTAGHETLIHETGSERLNYPDYHIEADNRLSWLLGRLEKAYGKNAFYVYLKRDPAATIKSFAKRIDFGILKAYEQGILMHEHHRVAAEDIAADYLLTVSDNIELFLHDKPHKLTIELEAIESGFQIFWHKISARGDLDTALQELTIPYNASTV
jgi:hypothetical protein